MEPQAGYRRFQSFGDGKAEEGEQQQLAEECGEKAAGARRGGLRLQALTGNSDAAHADPGCSGAAPPRGSAS